MFACCLTMCCECGVFKTRLQDDHLSRAFLEIRLHVFPSLTYLLELPKNLSSPPNNLFGFIMFQSISETFMLLSKLLFTLLIWNSCSRPIIIDSSLPGFLFCLVWAQTHHRRLPAKGRPHLVSAVLSNVLSYSDSTSGRPGSQVQLDDDPKTHLGR